MRSLFPELKTNQEYNIAVSGGHQIYVEESGNPQGIPVIYCHGGPGGGSDPIYRRFYDPQKYRIILFDQRGCGLSVPHCAKDVNALWHNTTQDLINDMEHIRSHLDIKSWLVAGGSWGSTLGLLYALEYPDRVLGLILRGIFLARAQDLDWLFGQTGAAQVFPEYHRQFIKDHEFENTNELLESFYQLLTGDNDLTQLAAAKQFANWEGRIAKLKPENLAGEMSRKESIATAMLNCHYFTHNSFIYEHQIISEIDRISHIPGFIIHGRYDMVCKAENATTLSEYWPNGALEIVPDAGHSCLEPGITDALVRASKQMAEFLEKKDQ